jgi:D-lyxose ketol-isomerase
MSTEVDSLQLHGPRRDEALRRAAEQLSQWGLTMPKAEPLVLDFGSGDFSAHGLIEYWAANETQAGYCGKFMFLFDGQTCPLHSHAQKHETFFVVKGRVKLKDEGQEQLLLPGDVYPVPTDRAHTFTAMNGAALILELSTPCFPRDNRFRDPWAKEWLKKSLG